jgi:hypothetical protein
MFFTHFFTASSAISGATISSTDNPIVHQISHRVQRVASPQAIHQLTALLTTPSSLTHTSTAFLNLSTPLSIKSLTTGLSVNISFASFATHFT